jgi:hypothetical protein
MDQSGTQGLIGVDKAENNEGFVNLANGTPHLKKWRG